MQLFAGDKPVERGVVGIARTFERFPDAFLALAKRRRKFRKVRIIVPQLSVYVAQKHVRIFGQCHLYIWQCGKYYKKGIDSFMEGKNLPLIHYSDFIKRMDLAYAASDVIITRSGASTVSELCAMEKAAIFVPSPNVAEDHQTHNAMALVKKDAAMIVKDAEAEEKLLSTALDAGHTKEDIDFAVKCFGEVKKEMGL